MFYFSYPVSFKLLLQKVTKKWEKTRSSCELLRDHTHFFFVQRKKGRTVSSFSMLFINVIATCNSSLDTSDIMEERSAGYFPSALSVSAVASRFCGQSFFRL